MTYLTSDPGLELFDRQFEERADGLYFVAPKLEQALRVDAEDYEAARLLMSERITLARRCSLGAMLVAVLVWLAAMVRDWSWGVMITAAILAVLAGALAGAWATSSVYAPFRRRLEAQLEATSDYRRPTVRGAFAAALRANAGKAIATAALLLLAAVVALSRRLA